MSPAPLERQSGFESVPTPPVQCPIEREREREWKQPVQGSRESRTGFDAYASRRSVCVTSNRLRCDFTQL